MRKYNPRIGGQASFANRHLDPRIDTKGDVKGLNSAGCSSDINVYAAGRVRVRWIGWDPGIDGTSVPFVLSVEAADVVSVSSGADVVGCGAGGGTGRAHSCGRCRR
jgi:hypothetical protein